MKYWCFKGLTYGMAEYQAITSLSDKDYGQVEFPSCRPLPAYHSAKLTKICKINVIL
jgi:hypothetical protein